MNIDPLNETELTEILQIAQDGEIKLKEMSDRTSSQKVCRLAARVNAADSNFCNAPRT